MYSNLGIVLLFFSLQLLAQSDGCTDLAALNYNPRASKNDGSCRYVEAIVTPFQSWDLSDILRETSGLIFWNENLWTHNDDSDTNLYRLDETIPANYQSFSISGVENIDWEEVTQDDNYIYIGDFGNNRNGNRTDLKIIKVKKQTLFSSSQEIEIIEFSYSRQSNFEPTGSNNTDFDCEAFIVTSENIFLFTKEWVSNTTSIYSLPKTNGRFVAKYVGSIDVEGLITGAFFSEIKNLVVLCGYGNSLNPFVFLLYDFSPGNFLNANKRKIEVNLPLHQVEAITTEDELIFYITNENSEYSTQKLHRIDLTNYLQAYFSTLSLDNLKSKYDKLIVFPNPFSHYLFVQNDNSILDTPYFLFDLTGRVVMRGKLEERNNKIDFQNLKNGIYFLAVHREKKEIFKVIKQ